MSRDVSFVDDLRRRSEQLREAEDGSVANNVPSDVQVDFSDEHDENDGSDDSDEFVTPVEMDDEAYARMLQEELDDEHAQRLESERLRDEVFALQLLEEEKLRQQQQDAKDQDQARLLMEAQDTLQEDEALARQLEEEEKKALAENAAAAEEDARIAADLAEKLNLEAQQQELRDKKEAVRVKLEWELEDLREQMELEAIDQELARKLDRKFNVNHKADRSLAESLHEELNPDARDQAFAKALQDQFHKEVMQHKSPNMAQVLQEARDRDLAIKLNMPPPRVPSGFEKERPSTVVKPPRRRASLSHMQPGRSLVAGMRLSSPAGKEPSSARKAPSSRPFLKDASAFSGDDLIEDIRLASKSTLSEAMESRRTAFAIQQQMRRNKSARLQNEFERLMAESARTIFVVQNPRFVEYIMKLCQSRRVSVSPPIEGLKIDFHYLLVSDARDRFPAVLELAIKYKWEHFRVICGEGNHSRSGVPKLAPALRKLLDTYVERRYIRSYRTNGGTYTITPFIIHDG